MTKIDSPSMPSLDPEQVDNFLRRHPHFLLERPELLAALNIPHGTPASVPSLIERQVAQLRTEHSQLRAKLAGAEDKLNANQVLTTKVLDASLELLEAGTPDDLCHKLHAFIRRHYHTDQAGLSLFLDQPLSMNSDFVSILGRNDKLRILLVELFNRQQPLFDSLQAEHLVLLFGSNADSMQSTALLPIAGHDWDGLLALGSHERDRYHRSQPFELLRYLTRITAFKFDHWFRTDNV